VADLYCAGQKRLQNTDSWYRTFKGHPKMSPSVKKMVRKFVEEDKLERAAFFFTNHCGFDSDYSEFLMRELIVGNL
jgi:hypothetical protein